MLTAITSATDPIAEATTSGSDKATAKKPSPTTLSVTVSPDTAQISGSAFAALQAAVQEATETPTQTATEAEHGDHQAQQLLAKEAAEQAPRR